MTFTPDTMETNVPTVTEATSLWIDVWKRFRKNRLAVIGLVFIVLLILIALFADVIAPYSISERDSANFRSGPSSDHWFGTDIIGRTSSVGSCSDLAYRCASASFRPCWR